ncbi:chymotrypsin BI [Folsomia candida]|nr:chymotrypsin BI [Folsomia candida]
MVALLYDNKVYCGGSIIDANHIVTAADCVVHSNYVTLLIGGHNINASNEDEPGRIIVNVTRQYIFVHPKWGVVPASHDIAIIRLPEKLTFSNNIRPICLPKWTRIAETFENQPAPKQSPCRGDVGGPLMIREGVDPHYTLVGIVSSWVNPFCEDGNPVFFTRITAVLDFIYEITGRNE